MTHEILTIITASIARIIDETNLNYCLEFGESVCSLHRYREIKCFFKQSLLKKIYKIIDNYVNLGVLQARIMRNGV